MKDGLSPEKLYLKILSGEIRRFPSGYFLYDTDNAASREIVRFFIRSFLGLKSREEVLLKLRQEDFRRHKLGGLLNTKYKSSPSKAAIDAFPEYNMKPWEFHETQNRYWRGEEGKDRGIEAVRYVFLEKCGLKPEEIGRHLNREFMAEQGLLGALRYSFDESLQLCGQACFPDLFAPWEIGTHVPNNYWTREKGTEALRWLIEEKLKLSREELLEVYDRSFIMKNNLYGMVQKCFGSNLYEALDSVYPGQIKIWEYPTLPPNFWSDDKVREAIRWLIFDKLKLSAEEAMRLTKKDFVAHGLYSLTTYTKGRKAREIIGEALNE